MIANLKRMKFRGCASASLYRSVGVGGGASPYPAKGKGGGTDSHWGPWQPDGPHQVARAQQAQRSAVVVAKHRREHRPRLAAAAAAAAVATAVRRQELRATTSAPAVKRTRAPAKTTNYSKVMMPGHSQIRPCFASW